MENSLGIPLLPNENQDVQIEIQTEDETLSSDPQVKMQKNDKTEEKM